MSIDCARAFSIRASAETHPDRIAVVTATEALTFRELWRRTERIALRLSTGRGPVAVVASLRVETVLIVYALAELGRPIVPVHPRLTAREREAVCADAGATVLFDEHWRPEDDEELGERGALPASDVGDEAPLAVLFTSGSSGSPKGVELSRRAFHAAALASAANLGWREDDRWLLCMPLAHVGGLSVVLRCLAARTTVVLSPWTGSIATLLADVNRHRVTLLSLVPTMLARVLAETEGPPFPAAVRAVLIGGDAASAALLSDARARSVPVLTTYGMTETCSQVATLAPGEVATIASGVGRPLQGTEVRIVDGEIHVRTPTLFTRYVPEERWPSPLVDGGWFPTGDLGHLDAEGRLHVTGRRSDMIITGGENVDPREVEGVLARCPGVRVACVFGVADDRWGQLVAAAIETEKDAAPSLDELAVFVKEQLAAHKRPRLVALGHAIALNATSKVDRRATAASAAGALTPLRVT